MAYAALVSGICLANAGLGAVHGLAAPIGALLPIAHGEACGALLVATVRTNLVRLAAHDDAEALARYATAGRVLAELPADAPGDEARQTLVGLLGAWVATLGAPGLGSLGLRAEQVDDVIAGVSTSSMSTNPVTLGRDDLAEIVLASL